MRPDPLGRTIKKAVSLARSISVREKSLKGSRTQDLKYLHWRPHPALRPGPRPPQGGQDGVNTLRQLKDAAPYWPTSMRLSWGRSPAAARGRGFADAGTSRRCSPELGRLRARSAATAVVVAPLAAGGERGLEVQRGRKRPPRGTGNPSDSPLACQRNWQGSWVSGRKCGFTPLWTPLFGYPSCRQKNWRFTPF